MQIAPQKTTPCLWFDTEAEDAACFYCSVFKDSRLGKINRYVNEGQEIHGKKAGSVMAVEFELAGQKFVALNGGPQFKFTEAVSLVVHCASQEEVDYYWDRLTSGGDPQAQQCGWLKDRFGLSWQVVPDRSIELLSDPDPEKGRRAMAALLQMKKIDMAALERAAAGVPAGAA